METEALTNSKAPGPGSALWDGFCYLGRIWSLGWSVVFKVLAGLFVVLILFIPLGLVAQIVSGLIARWPESSWLKGLDVAIVLLGVLIYLPCSVYVAASWVGLCPWIGRSEQGEGSIDLSRPVRRP